MTNYTEEDYDRFEKFISYFEDEEYEKWIDGENAVWKEDEIKGASDAQRERAMSLRTPVSMQEEEDIEAQQVFVEQESGVRTVDVGDNRDLPIIRRPVILETQATQPPRIVEPTPQERVILTPEKERVPLIRFTQPTHPVTVQKQQSSIRQAIAGLRARLASILRRNKKPNA